MDGVPVFFLINLVYGKLSVKRGTRDLYKGDLSQVIEIHRVEKAREIRSEEEKMYYLFIFRTTRLTNINFNTEG